MSREQCMHEEGFTLIEMIMVVVLIGFVTGAGLTVFSQVLANSIEARMDNERFQRLEIAARRILYELRDANTVSVADANTVQLTNPEGEVVEVTYVPATEDIRLALNDTDDDDLLLEDVSGYAVGERFLTYLQEDGSAWNTFNDISLLSEIQVRIVMAGARLDMTFAVTPRNNGLLNGPETS